MAAPQNFRSAWNGFHREDVVHYLEYLNAKHQNQVTQLNAEIDYLRQQLAAREAVAPEGQDDGLKAAYEAMKVQLGEAEAANSSLTAQLGEAEAANNTLTAQLEAAQGEKSALEAQLAQAEAAKAVLEARVAELERKDAPVVEHTELDSYRRAQNLERESRTRAELVYFQTNGVLGEASAKVERVAGEITELADQTMRELTRLQVAVSESKHALQDASAMMKSIRPNT